MRYTQSMASITRSVLWVRVPGMPLHTQTHFWHNEHETNKNKGPNMNLDDKTVATIERDGFIATLEINHMGAGNICQLQDLFMQLAMAVGYHPESVKAVMGDTE